MFEDFIKKNAMEDKITPSKKRIKANCSALRSLIEQEESMNNNRKSGRIFKMPFALATAIILLIILSILMISGCGQKTTTEVLNSEDSYDPFANFEVSDGEEISAKYGFGTTDPIVDGKIKYDKNMSLGLWIENSGSPSDFGIALYVDGIRQTYSMDNSDEKSNMHIISLSENEKKNFTVNFEPVAGEYNETLNFSYGVIYNFEFTISSATEIIGNNYRYSSYDCIMTDVPKDIALTDNAVTVESAPISEERKQEFISYDENGNINGNSLEDTLQLLALKNGLLPQDDDPAPNSVSNSDTLEIQLLGGKKQTWRVSMYIDNKLIPAFNGSYYADMRSGADEMSAYTVDLSKLDLPEKAYSPVYFIAAPVRSDYKAINQSYTMIYRGQEAGQ